MINSRDFNSESNYRHRNKLYKLEVILEKISKESSSNVEKIHDIDRNLEKRGIEYMPQQKVVPTPQTSSLMRRPKSSLSNIISTHSVNRLGKRAKERMKGLLPQRSSTTSVTFSIEAGNPEIHLQEEQPIEGRQCATKFYETS